ncbi:helix-turn-helix domain-containing protein [Allobranchiibius sp. CTAmp26]|uniref:helix-turn-helix domain-containing protein n=1 Tax=Allobranchiibius sp. CTAmp26 TaxID=2815214 RepID=UPI001AA14C0D|nr:XRE family transcriptional regulator [Allobranchiibius sp. CTAmp26]MBO1756606.1 helix-turn-helix transcriptional regulator [Allobranchiibius sp. CTAmp26]
MTDLLPEKSAVDERSFSIGPTPGAIPPGEFHGVGSGVRSHRTAKGLSLRELARRLGVSASFISQLENGKSQPSVATLVAICNALGVTFDELFAACVALDAPAQQEPPHLVGERDVARAGAARPATSDDDVAPRPHNVSDGPVMHAGARRRLALDTGVIWEQLSSESGTPAEFLLVTYEVGGTSTTGTKMSRHDGTDYGYVLSGELTLTLGFETHVLGPTDSISFDSNIPHRFHNSGDVPAQAVWFVHGT